ncbi:hypothetical protein ACE1TF_05785 [Geomicrobium sp. JSM 1781026]
MESFFADYMWLLIVVIVIASLFFIMIPLIEVHLSRGVMDGRLSV